MSIKEYGIWPVNPSDASWKTLIHVNDFPNGVNFLAAIKAGDEIQRAQKINPDLDHCLVTDEAIAKFGDAIIGEMFRLEYLSRISLPISDEVAGTVGRFAYLSAPGVYHHPYSHQKDNGKFPKSWTAGMDRLRNDATVLLAIKFLEKIHGEDFSAFNNSRYLLHSNKEQISLLPKIRELFQESDLRFLALANPEEMSFIDKVIQSNKAYVPTEIVDKLLTLGFGNTLQQMFDLKEHLGQVPKCKKNGLVIVTHAAHAVRALAMIQQHEVIPDWMNLYIHPLPSPNEGLYEYILQEARGALYYWLTGQAANKLPHYYGI